MVDWRRTSSGANPLLPSSSSFLAYKKISYNDRNTGRNYMRMFIHFPYILPRWFCLKNHKTESMIFYNVSHFPLISNSLISLHLFIIIYHKILKFVTHYLVASRRWKLMLEKSRVRNPVTLMKISCKCLKSCKFVHNIYSEFTEYVNHVNIM